MSDLDGDGLTLGTVLSFPAQGWAQENSCPEPNFAHWIPEQWPLARATNYEVNDILRSEVGSSDLQIQPTTAEASILEAQLGAQGQTAAWNGSQSPSLSIRGGSNSNGAPAAAEASSLPQSVSGTYLYSGDGTI